MKKDKILEELVIEEAINLKKYAKKEELDKLDYDNLDGDCAYKCIYGQMTGDCESNRAYNLIKKCAIKVYNVTSDEDRIETSVLNGKPKNLKNYSDRLEHYISPIERFLFFYKSSQEVKSTKIQKLVKFLRDETKELVL